MGSEHSAHLHGSHRQGSLNSKQSSNIRRQHTIANPGGGGEHPEFGENGRPGSISPGPSVCSDTDLPYISYTVNRPIGDSPKLTNKQIVKTKRKLVQKQPKKSAHNIVVVKPAATGPNVDKDPDILRLQSIPMFLPIMRATLNLPAARDPEVLERLDPLPLHKLCVKYQTHLTACANLIATEQNQLTQKVRETDCEIAKMVNAATDKQKKFAKYAEKLSRVQELSHQLNRCHMLLNQTLESMETLNNYLDIEDRLEPFVWTTG
ncbi:loss of heterozygosity 12 chromosomal region 1 protein [Asbolus verrucosus]|uniref:BLOC-1-related complex subunit 5 n=1 Tax=Asbolus verrucosus TaxID=1661398 RepID=A0A482WDL3_ASBVE|nr:loss of heterozygosity 12 chromosomal region 1 protein [Asbolus verrucosus]